MGIDYLVCFPSLRDHSPALPLVQHQKTVILHNLSRFIVFYYKSANVTSVSLSGQEAEVPANRTCVYLIPSAVLVFGSLQINSPSQVSLLGREDNHMSKLNNLRAALVEECSECYRN